MGGFTVVSAGRAAPDGGESVGGDVPEHCASAAHETKVFEQHCSGVIGTRVGSGDSTGVDGGEADGGETVGGDVPEHCTSAAHETKVFEQHCSGVIGTRVGSGDSTGVDGGEGCVRGYGTSGPRVGT